MTYTLNLTQVGTRVSINFDCDTFEEAEHLRQQVTMKYLDKEPLVITFKVDGAVGFDID